MHIIEDVNKILKTVQSNLTFILNALSESSIHFYLAFNSSRVALVSLVLHSCCIRVACVTLVSLVSGTRVVH